MTEKKILAFAASLLTVCWCSSVAANELEEVTVAAQSNAPRPPQAFNRS